MEVFVRAARRLQEQANGGGPLLGFTLGVGSGLPSSTYDYCEKEGLIALDEFLAILNEEMENTL